MESCVAPDGGLLANHEIVRTNSVERMSDALRKAYGGRLVSANCDDREFFGLTNRVQLEHISLAYCAFDVDVEIAFSERALICQQICLGGGGKTVTQGKSVPLSDESSCVISSGATVSTHFRAGYRHLLLAIDPMTLQRKLEAFVGADLPRPIDFDSAQTLVTPRARMLKRAALFFASEIEAFENGSCDLARGEFEQTLLAASLSGNRHNYSYLLESPPPSLTPRQVWQAEAFIEAHWDKPLTIESLAHAVGFGARSIFKAFKDHRGYSPMAFARNVRLRRARDLLREAGPGATVTAVAYRCGFQNHGHFAREYRARFGEPPSTTLARARRERRE